MFLPMCVCSGSDSVLSRLNERFMLRIHKEYKSGSKEDFRRCVGLSEE